MRPLQEYERKRNFKKTPEPGAVVPKKRKSKETIFVVQEHHASHLHYDFRLEMDGVLRSWAVPKGPSMDPSIKRLAVQVEDHPIPYAQFEGSIPAHEYGGGDVYIWDRGTWEPKGDPTEGFKKGKLEFELKGKKLKGSWLLFRTKRAPSGKPQWILIKRTDDYAQKGLGDIDIATVHDHLNPVQKLKKKTTTKFKASAAKTKSTPAKSHKGKKGFPEFVDVELALLVEAPPQGEGWIHETKYDGYRTEARVDQGNVQLLTRTAQNWTHKYPTVARALEKLKVDNAIFDGEVVWVDEKGRSDFQKLQNALKEKESSSIIYYVFDLLFLNGEDLRELPLLERKKRLEELLAPLKGTAVLFSDHVRGEAEEFLEVACDYQLEGIVSKKADSPYLSGRNENWVKSKCKQRQEFVIGGFTEGTGTRVGFGALLLGVYEEGKLRYVGRVGTGFNHESLLTLRKKLTSLQQKKNPFALEAPKGEKAHWVKPTLVAEIAFANWTIDGFLRVPVFQGLREDKPATLIHREEPAATPTSKVPTLKSFKENRKAKAVNESTELSHPEKVLFEEEGLTKLDVANYYKSVADWMMPHLSDRPLTLKRCPEGTSGECFIQKHSSGQLPETIATVQIKEKTGTRSYMTVDTANGVRDLVQKEAIELHAWNCRKQDVDHPDQLVLDLDPGPGIPWKKMADAALSMKKVLDQLDLKSFVKVTGSKGIHIHIPLELIYSWDQAKQFSLALAQQMVSQDPDLYTTTLSKSARSKKIFIDYLRNAQSATAVVPYSLRARAISAVALPVEWNELSKLTGADFFTVEKALEKVKSRKQDPWKDFLKSAQKISILDVKPQKKKRA
jgi:bifunctional non-homologous end joining protein LigD